MSDVPTFKIGVSLPLTGPLAEYGEAVRNGIDLALEDQPGLRTKVRFIYEDNSYDAKKAVGNLQKLVDVDGINLFLVWGNEPALSVAPVAEQRKVPTITLRVGFSTLPSPRARRISSSWNRGLSGSSVV